MSAFFSGSETSMMAINRYVDATNDFLLYWFKRRVKRQNGLVNFLRGDPNKDQIERFLITLFLGPEKNDLTSTWWLKFNNLLIEVFTSLERKQILKLTNLFENYVGEMRELSKK